MANDRGTNYYPFRPDVWSLDVDRFFYIKLALAPFFWDLSSQVSAGGKTIVIPKTAEAFVPFSITTTTGVVTDNVISDTVVRLDVDKWYAVSRLISDWQKAQILSGYGSLAFYQEDMAYALAKQLDESLMTTGDGSSTGLQTGTSTSEIGSSGIENALRIMESYSIPRSELHFFLHPTPYWKGVLSRQKYYDASQFGKATLPYGINDMLFGVPVTLTTNVQRDQTSTGRSTAAGGRKSGFQNFLLHPRSLAYAIGALDGAKNKGVRVQFKSTPDLNMRVVADIAYGTKSVSTTRAVRIKSTTG